MKKRFLILLLVLALSAVSGLSLVTAQEGTEHKALTAADIALYELPDDGSEVVAELPAYTEVYILGTDETGVWLEVEADAGVGFAPVEDFIILNLPQLAPQVMVATSRAGNTSLFAAPSFGADFLGAAPDGTVAYLLGTDGEWAYAMTANGQTVWSIVSDWSVMPGTAYLGRVATGRAPELGIFAEAQAGSDLVATVPDGKALYVLGMEGQWAEVLLMDGTMGYAVAANIAEVPNVWVEADVSRAQAALYAEPNQTAEIIEILDPGNPVYLMGAVDEYWAELFDPALGTVYALNVNLGNAYTPATVPVGESIVRAGPNDNIYTAIAELPRGTRVIAKGLSETEAWVQVAVPFGEIDFAYNGVDGWMRDYLFVDEFGESDLNIDILDITE
jgi:hypothetical protein